MRTVIRTCLILLLACRTIPAADSKPDFSGKWTLDAAKSDAAGGEFTIEIRHNEPEFVLIQIRGEERVTFRMTTDGQECVNPYLGAEMKSRMRWDGADLRVDSSFGTTTLKDRMSLSEDGRTITSLRHMTTADGERNMKFVFRKEEK